MTQKPNQRSRLDMRSAKLLWTIWAVIAIGIANAIRLSIAATPTPSPGPSASPPVAVPLSLYVNNDDGMMAKITWSTPKWRLSVNEPDFNVSHSNPNEVTIYFVGTDGSKWKATGWTKQ